MQDLTFGQFFLQKIHRLVLIPKNLAVDWSNRRRLLREIAVDWRPRRLAEEAPAPPRGKRSLVRKSTAVFNGVKK
jgi:hypothetical protein